MDPTHIQAEFAAKKHNHSNPSSHSYPSVEGVSVHERKSLSSQQKLGIVLLILAFGGLISAFWPLIQVEANYRTKLISDAVIARISWYKKVLFSPIKLPVLAKTGVTPTPTPVPRFNPLVAGDGSTITPVNTDFALVVPKIGINAPVIEGVNPGSAAAYTDALKKGVAHAATSMLPNQNGTVYLFSHSTNYEWFVKDLNAIFYLLKNLEPGDTIVIVYLGQEYTYRLRDKKIVSPNEISYLVPQQGQKTLILQTCWPPGTVSKRMLLFADLFNEQPYLTPDEAATSPSPRGSFAQYLVK